MASTLMFWNKQNSNSNQNGNDAKNTKNGRNWLHAPDVLVNGHVAYLVKFLGTTPVEQAKGIEVVKEAIRRLQFTQQMKKAEGGSNVKTKKVEITISVDGVAIQEPRTQTILHQFPLHKISYCADEKGVKKFFSFIAKTGSSSATPSLSASDDTHSSHSGDHQQQQDGGQHECFVFISNKLASDITLTIGQAFDLAYRRYVNDSGKTVDSGKLHSQNKQLENTVNAYRQRLKDLSELVPKPDLDKLLLRHGLRDICEVPAMENGIDSHVATVNGSKTPDLGIDVSLPNNDDQLLIETSPKHFAPIVPPRNIQNQINSTLEAFKPSVGTKMEGLLLNSDSDSDFDPRAPDNDSPSIGGNKISNDLFGFEPPKQSLGQQLFTTSNAAANNNNNNIHAGFTNGNNGTTNGFGAPTSPPPILAPPPQKSAPRRTTPAHQNNGNGYQDLFGSAPFNPQALDDTSFESSFEDSAFSVPAVSSFSDEMRILADNSSKLDSVLAFNNALRNGPSTFAAATAAPGPIPAQPSSTNIGTTKLNPFASLAAPAKSVLRANPLATVMNGSGSAYDVFQNASDASDHLNGSISPAAPPHHALSSAGTLATTAQQQSASVESEAMFQDFALSAFNEFKRDLSNTSNNGQQRRPATAKGDFGGKGAASIVGTVGNVGTTVGLNGARVLVGASGTQFHEQTTSKNGLFSSDDLLDTFDPLKK